MTKIERLKRLWAQPSTKRGLIGLLSLCGIAVSPEHWDVISIVAGLAFSVYEIMRDEDAARKVVIALCLLPFLAGCAGLQGIKPVAEMTPQEKATWFLESYNSQYDLYQQQAAQPNLTESQIKILKAKREVLLELHPAALMYGRYVQSGAIPAADLEAKVIGYIEKLLSAAEGGSK